MNKKKRSIYTIGLLTITTLLTVGCSSNSKAQDVVSKKDSVASKSVKSNDSMSDKLKKAESLAEKNKESYKSELKGVERLKQDVEYAYASDTPKTVSEMTKSGHLTARCLVVNTEFIVEDKKPRTLYTVFVKDVYSGDKSKLGKTLKVMLPGGKILNSIYYEDYQNKIVIPEDKKLTPEQLKGYTLVQYDGYDPVNPGDEILAALTGLYEPTVQDTVYTTPSAELTFFKPKNAVKFEAHTSNIESVGGGTNSNDDPKGSNGNAQETKEKNDRDVNEMVRTHKVPKS